MFRSIDYFHICFDFEENSIDNLQMRISQKPKEIAPRDSKHVLLVLCALTTIFRTTFLVLEEEKIELLINTSKNDKTII